MATIPEAFPDVFRARTAFARLATVGPDGADAHIDALAKKYLGQDRYPCRRPAGVRVIFRIHPERVQTRG